MNALRTPWLSSVSSHLPDEELVRLARIGHRDAAEMLVRRYRPVLEKRARAYYLPGADHDDLVQEGLIALCGAIRDFRPERLAVFRPFAERCALRGMQSAIRASRSLRLAPLNSALSYHSEVGGSRLTVSSRWIEHLTLSHSWYDLHQVAVHAELTELERQVFEGFTLGYSYKELSQSLGCPRKRVDNALQRARRKVGPVLKESCLPKSRF